MLNGTDTMTAGQLAAHFAVLPPDLPVWVSVDDKAGGIEAVLSIQEVYEGDPDWDDPYTCYIFATE